MLVHVWYDIHTECSSRKMSLADNLNVGRMPISQLSVIQLRAERYQLQVHVTILCHKWEWRRHSKSQYFQPHAMFISLVKFRWTEFVLYAYGQVAQCFTSNKPAFFRDIWTDIHSVYNTICNYITYLQCENVSCHSRQTTQSSHSAGAASKCFKLWIHPATNNAPRSRKPYSNIP